MGIYWKTSALLARFACVVVDPDIIVSGTNCLLLLCCIYIKLIKSSSFAVYIFLAFDKLSIHVCVSVCRPVSSVPYQWNIMYKIYPQLEYEGQRGSHCGQIFSKGRDFIEKLEDANLGPSTTRIAGYDFNTRQLWGESSYFYLCVSRHWFKLDFRFMVVTIL